MENLNNNIELNVGLLWFSAVITLFILLGVVTDKTRSRPFMKCFTALLATNILMLLGESGKSIAEWLHTNVNKDDDK